MIITKRGHACVVVDTGQGRVVLDPGLFSEPLAGAGVDAVLITHEHADHFDPAHVRAAAQENPALTVWTNRSVAAQLSDLGDRVHAVGAGDTFTVAGTDVQVHGELHAQIHPDIPRIANVGFLVGGELFHPGDALTVPQQPVQALMLPLYAPWSRVAEVIDYVREVGPDQAVAVHDAGLSDIGYGVLDRLLGPDGPGTGTRYVHLAVGEQLDLPAPR